MELRSLLASLLLALVAGCGGPPSATECMDIQNNPLHCGACGHACTPMHANNPICVNGACAYDACATDFGDCDNDPTNGCETALDGDVHHCGACGTACAPDFVTAPTCVNGACGYAQCAEGHGDCDGNLANGCEADLANDAGNCGGCGKQCDSGAACMNGGCVAVCVAPLDHCGSGVGFCTLTSADPANCGSCGHACKPLHAVDPACANGTCGYDKCDPGYGDCDGDTSNGCETCLTCDINNCGGCGVLCNPVHVQGADCRPGTMTGVASCTFTQCATGWGNCDGNSANGCEADILHDDTTCGPSCTPCNPGLHCTNGACM